MSDLSMSELIAGYSPQSGLFLFPTDVIHCSGHRGHMVCDQHTSRMWQDLQVSLGGEALLGWGPGPASGLTR